MLVVTIVQKIIMKEFETFLPWFSIAGQTDGIILETNIGATYKIVTIVLLVDEIDKKN